MSPSVLYRCPCDFGVVKVHATDDKQEGSSTSIPPLPFQCPSARYSYHPLSSLYYCADCISPRCQLCATSEIITHHCPSCLFEVPSASVKAERNRCPRNCFLCPTVGCGAYLNVVATDPLDYGRLESVEASIGIAPYFLSCGYCRWDSKSKQGGSKQSLVFEKPTGISSQLEAQSGPPPVQVEYDKLRSHYEAHFRKLNAAGNSTRSNGLGGLPSSASSRSLKTSKLLRDLPGLENSKYLNGGRRAANLSGEGAAVSETIPPYTSAFANQRAPTDDGTQEGHVGRSEESDRAWLASLGGSEYGKLSGVEERWSIGSDQGLRSAFLEPLRVSLVAKSTLRCSTCRHILIKPDPKANSNRWKIKLSALNYLPELNLIFRGLREAREDRNLSALSRRTSGINLTEGSSIAQRSKGRSSLLYSAGEDINPEKLRRGKTYQYELSFKNPLEDVIAVQLDVYSPFESQTSESTETAVDPPPWTVQASATRFSVKPYDDVDMIDDGLLEDPRKADSDSKAGTLQSSGIVRQKGNETVIALRLEISLGEGKKSKKDGKKKTPVEVPVSITFTYRMEPLEHEGSAKSTATPASKGEERSLQFWTALRFGRIEEDEEAEQATVLPSSRVSATLRQAPSAFKPLPSVDVATEASNATSATSEEDRERMERLKKRRSELQLGSALSSSGRS